MISERNIQEAVVAALDQSRTTRERVGILVAEIGSEVRAFDYFWGSVADSDRPQWVAAARAELLSRAQAQIVEMVVKGTTNLQLPDPAEIAKKLVESAWDDEEKLISIVYHATKADIPPGSPTAIQNEQQRAARKRMRPQKQPMNRRPIY